MGRAHGQSPFEATPTRIGGGKAHSVCVRARIPASLLHLPISPSVSLSLSPHSRGVSPSRLSPSSLPPQHPFTALTRVQRYVRCAPERPHPGPEWTCRGSRRRPNRAGIAEPAGAALRSPSTGARRRPPIGPYTFLGAPAPHGSAGRRWDGGLIVAARPVTSRPGSWRPVRVGAGQSGPRDRRDAAHGQPANQRCTVGIVALLFSAALFYGPWRPSFTALSGPL